MKASFRALRCNRRCEELDWTKPGFNTRSRATRYDVSAWNDTSEQNWRGTWSVILREELWAQMLQRKVQRRIFGPP